MQNQCRRFLLVMGFLITVVSGIVRDGVCGFVGGVWDPIEGKPATVKSSPQPRILTTGRPLGSKGGQ
jgi:hypothetical protein